MEVPKLSVFPTQLPLSQITNTRWGRFTATQQCGECDQGQAGERCCLKRLLLKGLIFEEFIKAHNHVTLRQRPFLPRPFEEAHEQHSKSTLTPLCLSWETTARLYSSKNKEQIKKES